jgi:hypothetical protein
VCQADEEDKLTWKPLEAHEIADGYRIAFGFVDAYNRFSDKNILLENVDSDGSVFIPKEYLGLQDGEQVYAAVVNKKTRVMRNTGAVVLSNTQSKMTMTFPSSLPAYFK